MVLFLSICCVIHICPLNFMITFDLNFTVRFVVIFFGSEWGRVKYLQNSLTPPHFTCACPRVNSTLVSNSNVSLSFYTKLTA